MGDIVLLVLAKHNYDFDFNGGNYCSLKYSSYQFRINLILIEDDQEDNVMTTSKKDSFILP